DWSDRKLRGNDIRRPSPSYARSTRSIANLLVCSKNRAPKIPSGHREHARRQARDRPRAVFPRRALLQARTQPAESFVKLGRVGEFRQDRIVSRRLQQSDHTSKNWIQQGLGMPHVKIERREIATKMQFRVVIEGAATIEGQPI